MSSVPFASPALERGDIVYWYDGGARSSAGHVAIVTNVGSATICVNIVDPNSYNMRIRDGVRHLDDPRARDSELQENGAWDYTPRMRREIDRDASWAEARKILDELAGKTV